MATNTSNNIEQFNVASKEIMDRQLHTMAALSRQMQTIATETAEFARRAMETNNQFVERLMSQKSAEGLMEVQSDYARTAYENWTREAKHFGELYQGLATEFLKPVEEVTRRAANNATSAKATGKAA